MADTREPDARIHVTIAYEFPIKDSGHFPTARDRAQGLDALVADSLRRLLTKDGPA